MPRIRDELCTLAVVLKDHLVPRAQRALVFFDQRLAEHHQIERFRLEAKTADFAPADGQHVVQQLDHAANRRRNALKLLFFLLRSQAVFILAQDVARRLDHGQRRAELVRGHRDETGPDARQLALVLQRLPQLALQLLARRDVVQAAHQPLRLVLVVKNG